VVKATPDESAPPGRNVRVSVLIHGFRCAPPVATFRRPSGAELGGTTPGESRPGRLVQIPL